MKKLILLAMFFACAGSQHPAPQTTVSHNWNSPPPDDMIVDFKVSSGWRPGKEFPLQQSLKADKVAK